MTLTPRRLRMLLLVTACDLAIWIIAGLFATSELYRRSIVLGGGGTPWDQVLDVQMVTALNWAMFTPLVLLIAQRLPFRPPHRLRNAAVVVAIIPILAVIRAAMGGVVLNLGEHQPVSLDMAKLSIGIRTHRYAATLAVVFFLYNLVEAHREAAERERQRVRTQTLLARTTLDELRTRLQPQFALRMLRHIGTVMRDEPKAADAFIVDLSGILRRSMTRQADERIQLADELEHFDRCLDLCRAGGRFAVATRYVAGDELLARRVPAHVLQPVIETVVLDLTAGAGGSVEIRCQSEGEATRVEVRWSVIPDGSAMRTTLRIPIQEAA